MSYLWAKQACPICGEAPRRFVGYRGGKYHRSGLGVETQIWRCRECDLFFPDPMPIPKGGLGQHYTNLDEYFASHDNREMIEGANRILDEAEAKIERGRMLDIGAGRGNFTFPARDRGWQVTALEPSPDFAARLRSKDIDVLETTLENCSFADTSFDVVLLGAVLEHLYNPTQVMAIIGKILRPGGLVFFDVPNERGLYFRLGNAYLRLIGDKSCTNLSPTFSPFHIFGFSMKSIAILLSRNSLAPTRVTYYGGTSQLQRKPGIRGAVESAGTQAVLSLSNIMKMGTFIEMWAQKSERNAAA